MRQLKSEPVKRWVLLSSGALILFAVRPEAGHAREWPCTRFAGFPVLIDGCEGERCESRENTVVKDVTLYAKPDARSEIVARLKKGQKIQSITHKTLVTQMGKFVVGEGKPEPEAFWAIEELKQYGVQIGDVIFGVQYGGEGLYKHCIGEKLFYLRNAYGLDMKYGAKNELQTEAWSFVKSKNASGWAPGNDWYIALVE